jgi:hypothetical protein
MDRWAAVAVFLLGAGLGALLTRIMYASQIRQLRKMVESLAIRSDQTPSGQGQDQRLSA